MSLAVVVVAGLCALPWVLVPLVVLLRLRHSTMLDAYPVALAADTPMVSVIVPARDEARNIEACVRSILGSLHPRFEVIVVDDHSTDGTGDIARAIAATDSRVRVIGNPELPPGWFGKQWACHNGARAAAPGSSDLLLFTDADTRHGPELLSRAVNALATRGADLLSVVGFQAMDSFWERLIQPHIFTLLLGRYGGTDTLSRSADPLAKIANGQWMLVRRATYDAAGGHEAVRSHVAEDLRMAQEWCRLGYSVQCVVGTEHLSTRMYEGFGEIVRGWGKNVYAGGRDTVRLGPVGQAVLRVIYPLPALWEIVPVAMLLAGTAGLVSPAVGLWGAIAYAATCLYWSLVYGFIRQPAWYALIHPLAAAVIFGIFTRSAWKGGRVEWKGRAYVSR